MAQRKRITPEETLRKRVSLLIRVAADHITRLKKLEAQVKQLSVASTVTYGRKVHAIRASQKDRTAG